MSQEDIRWEQRLQNYNKALGHLSQALHIEAPDMVQKAGIIQFFEMSFELGWNLLKDFMEAQGLQDVKSPRSALKKAYESGLISHGHVWMELLADRNLSSHTYDEQKATELEGLIRRKYFPLLEALQRDFNAKTS
ncbi:MAG: HI0074 family nucleotidyltransferase substrate-binding subunit [Bacteroidetes bacterium]|nr:HI0074 family nucleotidyltransferase substrate-binding subunit [Bacteroidota bacterium]